MWLFGKKKKQKEEEKRRQEELARQAKIEEEKKAKLEKERQEKELKELAEKKAEEKKQAEEAKKQSIEEPVEKKAPVKKSTQTKKVAPSTTAKKSPSGKYEVYPEAGLFKYRLKASNGEILVVSFGYSTRKGAKTGIDTFMKAVEGGNFDIVTDKAGYSHFDLFGARSARVIAIGEFYQTLKLAESAVESVKNFYKSSKVVDLDEIPAKEVREEIVEIPKIEENKNGKFQLIKDGKQYLIKLVASNAQVLLVSQKYASKQTALNGLEAIKSAIEARSFTVSKDKQNRWQYNLYTANKQLIVSGETYPIKQNAISSIHSVVRFAGKAELVEL